MKDDVWVPTACSLCYSICPIMVHRVDGVVVRIEGNHHSEITGGKVCPRGIAGIMMLYDPNRVNVPLKRTNPEKGIGVDPKWKEISWDEALGIVAEKMKKIISEDPRKIMGSGTVVSFDPHYMCLVLIGAIGSPNFHMSGAGNHCGNAQHGIEGLNRCAWSSHPDPNHMKYYLNFGCPSGFGLYYGVTTMARRLADNRVLRGMKQVAVDPWMGQAAAKADEWIPIRTGTDAAMALAMVNVLINELGIYDAESLKHDTNAPYLVRPDSYYVRDEATNKPLVWDPVDNKAKTYDDPTIKDLALEGDYDIKGVHGRPAFSLLKEHVKKYTPEMASEITTVPADTIRRVAREFGEAAQIGSTIVIEGKEYPYRPAGALYFTGAQGHKHATLNCMAIELLNAVVGASQVPGGILGQNNYSLGHPESGLPAFKPHEGPDGMMAPEYWVLPQPPWPIAEPRKPELYTLQDLITTSACTSPLFPLVMLDPDKFKMPYKIEMHIQLGNNYIMTMTNPELVAQAFKDVFSVSFNLYLDEASYFSDIVLPDACYLERLDIFVDWMANNSPVDWWEYHLRQPVVSPMFKRRPHQEVLLELAERVGILPKMNATMNAVFGIKGEFALDPSKKYSWEEIVDRRYKSLYGKQHGLDYFKQHHGLLKWPKKAEETYWRPFVKARSPIYYEHFKRVGEKIEKIIKEYDLPELDVSDFQPLPDWKPCDAHEEKRPEYDMFAHYYRVPLHTFTSSGNNPWISDASKLDPYIYHICINTETGKRKGISDGDWVEVESAATGKKVRARCKLVEGVHPELVAISGVGGHWSKYLPIASQRGKGVNMMDLLPLSIGCTDPVGLNQDMCVRVKIRKVRGEGK